MNRTDTYVLLTGATGAIGREIAKGLAERGRNIIISCRNEEKGDALLKQLKDINPQLNHKMLLMDMADSRSVVSASNSIKDLKLEGIINNAGVMMRRFETTREGVERTVAVNYNSTRLLTEMLLDNIVDGGVVVFTTSLTRFMPVDSRLKDYDNAPVTEKNFSQLGTYALSKQLLTDFAADLKEKMSRKGIRINCADPGVVNSGMIHMDRWYDRLADIFFRPLIRSPRKGAIPALRAFNSSDSGRIYCRWRTHRLVGHSTSEK